MEIIQAGARALREHRVLKRHFGRELADLTLAQRMSKPGGESWKALEKGIHLQGVKLLKAYAPDPSTLPPFEGKPIGRDCPVWVYWAQGEEEMPPIIRRCLDSVGRNTPGHEVHLLTSENLTEYVDIPEIFTQRLKEGCFGYTHFSDLLRCCLLYQQGGLYLDAGMFLTRPIPPRFLDQPFFSVNHGQGADWLIGMGMWIAGVLGTAKGHPAPFYWQKTLEAYWQDNRVLAVYGLFDDAMALCFREVPDFAGEVVALEPSCPGVFDICDKLGQAYNEADYRKAIEENFMLRLSYKLPKTMAEDSFYHRITQEAQP